jgi:NAD+ synthase (glutamine-hydrolysing)
MQINLHQTHHEIGDFESIFSYLTTHFLKGNCSGLHLFPELFLTGYPLQDLVLQKSFIDEYQVFLDDLSVWSERQFKVNGPCALLMGGLHYSFDEHQWPSKISNVIYLLTPGKKPEVIYTKQLLPNYDIYEEKKYFTAGNTSAVFKFENKNIGLLICEDMWFSHLHSIDPVTELKKLNVPLDLVINLSASPFHLKKSQQRIDRALCISNELNAPFAYVNRVGAEDEIVFDGQSFVVDGKKVTTRANAFNEQVLSLKLPTFEASLDTDNKNISQPVNTWGNLFIPAVSPDSKSLLLLSETELENALNAIIFSTEDYARKNNMTKFLVALSGGIDSAIVVAILYLMKKSIPSDIEAVFMPGLFSSSQSFDLSYDLCRNLGIRITTLPIKFIHSTIRTVYRDNFHKDLKGLADENIQSRLRGALIYTRANDTGAMVINTSNKSELAVGYSTIYGDSVGAISMLGDLYKTEVYQLAEYINRKYNNIIPQDILSRAPTAELRENQEDSQSLPPYPVLDPILESLLSFQYSPEDLVKKGHKREEVYKIANLLHKAEYKRKQFCPIIKLKAKSFGFGYRMPISKKLF